MFKSTSFCEDLFLKTRDVSTLYQHFLHSLTPNFILKQAVLKKNIYYFILNLNQYLVATNQ